MYVLMRGKLVGKCEDKLVPTAGPADPDVALTYLRPNGCFLSVLIKLSTIIVYP